MKLLTISAVLALAACVSATPAGHMNLAKRGAVATKTLIVHGKTVIEVIDAATKTETETTTHIKTHTITETDNSYIYSFSGTDTSGIIERLRSKFSKIIENTSSKSSSSSSSSSSTPP